MPRLRPNEAPAYRLHKQSGQAVVTLNQKDHLLGEHNSPESHQRYRALIAQWFAQGRRLVTPPPTATPRRPTGGATVAQAMAAYKAHCEVYYRRPDGTPTGEADTIGYHLRPLRLMFGKLAAADFDVLKLKSLRESLMRADTAGGRKKAWCRSNINHAVSRIKSFFKWAASERLAPSSVWADLMTMKALEIGRTNAPESEPVEAVADDVVHATLPHAPAVVAAMIQLQRLTGARPGEICAMRTVDIDVKGEIWFYKPPRHKTAHRRHTRTIAIGPKAQEVLRPWLKPLNPEAFIFSPQDAVAAMRERRRQRRRTPKNHGNRPGSNVKPLPSRTAGDRYISQSYARAVKRAAEMADKWAHGGLTIPDSERIVPHWHPHQLRHAAATQAKEEHGIEAAGAMLGHRSLNVTETYTHSMTREAARVAAKIG